MWEKLKNLFFARALNRHRLLFQFWDGSRFVSADPFVLLRKMLNTDKFDLEADLKMLELPDPSVVAKKIGHLAEGVQEIFEVPAFDKGGLSELECVNLLFVFTEFLATVKKNGVSNLITSPGSAKTQAAPSSPDVKSTNENSGSISTPIE